MATKCVTYASTVSVPPLPPSVELRTTLAPPKSVEPELVKSSAMITCESIASGFASRAAPRSSLYCSTVDCSISAPTRFFSRYRIWSSGSISGRHGCWSFRVHPPDRTTGDTRDSANASVSDPGPSGSRVESAVSSLRKKRRCAPKSGKMTYALRPCFWISRTLGRKCERRKTAKADAK